MAYSGFYIPINPKKYNGNPANIVYRSLWERHIMEKLDLDINVVEWSSEELSIIYRSPLDGRIHRYFPDFLVKMKTIDSIKTFLLEIKPAAQLKEPVKPKKLTKRFIQEVKEWGINQSKWTAAKQYCETKGWIFQIITENDPLLSIFKKM